MLLAHINLSGLPRNLWKVPQTFGRAGRDEKLQAVGVQMYWPGQKGLLIWIFYKYRNARNPCNNYHNRVYDTFPGVIVENKIFIV